MRLTVSELEDAAACTAAGQAIAQHAQRQCGYSGNKNACPWNELAIPGMAGTDAAHCSGTVQWATELGI